MLILNRENLLSASSFNADCAAHSTGHWQQLTVLLRQAPAIARSLLHKPPLAAIPSETCLSELALLAEQTGLTELFDRHLLSGFLLTPRNRQYQWPRSVHALAGRVFPVHEQKLTESTHWIQIPILAVQGTCGRVVTMMLGLLPDSTGCHGIGSTATDTLTGNALCATCCPAGRENGFVYWFLQAADEQPVQGNSLTLPVALGIELLNQAVCWPKGLYATGDLKPDGTIAGVDHVMEKYRCVAPMCRLFLVPADTGLPDDSNLPIHGCPDLDNARFAAQLFSGDTPAADIALFQACRVSRRNFFNHFHELPTAILQSDKARSFLSEVAAEPENHLERIVPCFNRCSHDRQRGQIMAELFTSEQILTLAETSPALDFSAFNWCLAAVAFHNHCGQTWESCNWSSCADALRSRVDLKEIGKAVNHNFVSLRFNRYDFFPEPGSEFAKTLQQEEQKQAVYPGSNALLGALYGTLAQNYGFCGPCHLSSLLDMTGRARQAFARKYHRETERLLNYEIYGYLDSGDTERAGQLLGTYLELDKSSEPAEWLRRAELLLTHPDNASAPFKAALAIRLLSENNFLPISDITGTVAAICGQYGHPWQLTALNMGRISANAGTLEDAEQLFRHSLRICLADSDTMRPMGLLALAELQAAGLANDNDYTTAEEIQKWLRHTDRLNSRHFQIILELREGKELLYRVKLERNRLFPFSYR